MITCEERKNRLLKANNLMKRLNLNSILVVGNGSVATNEYGFYRYFVDNRVYYHRQALVMVADETPTVCCGSLTHLKALNERGFWDVRMVGDRLAEGLVDILGSRGITNGRIGYCPETLPASWFDCIHSAYPELEWVDCTMDLYEIRKKRSSEECRLVEKCAELALSGYEALCAAVQNNVTESKLVSELDYAMKKQGAEETFTILNCGFLNDANGMGLLHSAANSQKAVKYGDCIAAAITPRYNGYWVQMLRTLCVGKENQTAVAMHEAVTGWISAAAKLLIPGNKVSTVAQKIEEEARAAGYTIGGIQGYICGVDLREQPISAENETKLTQDMTVILSPIILKDGNDCGFCWGDTYLVTVEGGRCLTEDGKSLKIIKSVEG